MASFVQSRLGKIKPSAKNVIEKYKEVFEQALKELKTPEELKQGLETFLAASKNVVKVYSYNVPPGHSNTTKEATKSIPQAQNPSLI